MKIKNKPTSCFARRYRWESSETLAKNFDCEWKFLFLFSLFSAIFHYDRKQTRKYFSYDNKTELNKFPLWREIYSTVKWKFSEELIVKNLFEWCFNMHSRDISAEKGFASMQVWEVGWNFPEHAFVKCEQKLQQNLSAWVRALPPKHRSVLQKL